MINKIIGVEVNTGININAINKKHFINFKSETDNKNITVPEIKDDKGLEALATYNSAIVKKPFISKDQLNIEPLPQIMSGYEFNDEIEGERIYSSDGKLYAIIRRDENTYTVYTPDEDNNNLIQSVRTYDKCTKKVVNAQYNEIKDGKYNGCHVEKNDAKDGKPILKTIYNEDGSLYSTTKYLTTPNGKEKEIYYNYEDKGYGIYLDSPNDDIHISAHFDDKKQLLNYFERYNNKYQSKTTEINFYHGAPVKIYSSKEITIPNTLGWENFIDKEEFKPADHIETIEHLKNIDGEKTYYSNGALESNTFDSDNGKTTAFFCSEGSCYKIENDKHSVIFYEESEVITEKLDDGRTKETTLYNNGSKYVIIKDENSYKELFINKKGKPSYYEEGIYDNGEEKTAKYLSFENGCLDYAREYSV